jgi:DNA (cytosine-5)-methyltransferase 1
MDVVSLFSGAGGLDLGFEKAGFHITWANEYDKSIWETFRYNFPKAVLDTRSIVDIPTEDLPKAFGVVGGPPCQSWSEAGAGRGLKDKRGQLFFEYIRVLKAVKPTFFLAENVSGILLPKHKEAFTEILKQFNELDYNISYELLNASDFGVPQDRKRLIIVGFRKDTGKTFKFPEPLKTKKTLKEAIGDLEETVVSALPMNKTNGILPIPNHEYMTGGFSTIFMSRNRVRSWDEQSFTIQAGGRHAPIHPQAPKMKFIEQDKRIFMPGKEHLYRRFSVRECARIQTFPDSFIFKYTNIADGYKMIGNAVPVQFANVLANSILKQLT